MRVTLFLASLALAACTAPPAHPTEGLAGRDVTALREHLGPPVDLSAGHGALRLSYRNRDGEVVDDAVIVLGRTIVQVRDDLVPTSSEGLAAELALTPVHTAIERLGPIRQLLQGSSSTRLRFDGWTAMVLDDLVLALVKT